MGGSAFLSAFHNIYTPRMPPAIYHQVKSACHDRLRELYLCVASPIEGPGKEDHGDVDILVALEREAVFPSVPGSHAPRIGREALDMIGVALGAVKIIYAPDRRAANMAIPWPEEADVMVDAATSLLDVTSAEEDGPKGMTDTSRNSNTAPQELSKPRRHIQVDIRIAPSVEAFQWALFKHAHGDFWPLVGSFIRPMGLTVDEEGLWIRVSEIEAIDRKKAKIHLSSEPTEILDFLGYGGYWDMSFKCKKTLEQDVEESDEIPDDDTGNPGPGGIWERPFDSVELLFEYVTDCSWFWLPAHGDTLAAANGQPPLPLRKDDRRRVKGRPVYRRWIEEYLPSLRASGECSGYHTRFTCAEDMRPAVREEAFKYWPGVREAYNRRLREWVLEERIVEQREELLNYIKHYVLTIMGCEDRNEDYVHVAISALKKIILTGDTSFDGIRPYAPLRDEDGLYKVDEAKFFVWTRGVDIAEVAWRIQCQKAKEAMEMKALKRKAAEEALAVVHGQAIEV